MRNRSLAAIGIVHVISTACAAAGPIRAVRPDDATGTSAAVVVDDAANLFYTRQLLPVGADQKVIAPKRADLQAAAVLDRLESTLMGAQSGLDQLVKVDVYLARANALGTFQKAFARRMPIGARPAVSYVVGALPRAEALVALDAIAVTSLSGEGTGRRVGVLPSGSRMFVSGQADPDDDLIAATRKTLRSLGKTLGYLGLDISRVVRLKAFMQPMTAESAADVEREVSVAFGGKDVPPLSLVEWRLSPRQPIEIELVAAGREPIDAPVEYYTPPGLTPSPVFSRVARVSAGPLIYVSGLHGAADTSNTEQVEAIFATLTGVLSQAGSDLRHLVKATYYVSDIGASTALNELRPQYFEPSRPPAASKAFVSGVGFEGRTVTLDMIAVPARK